MTSNRLKSMTGFGRARADTPFGEFAVELRSVNNRFLDLSVSLPRELSALEFSSREFALYRFGEG